MRSFCQPASFAVSSRAWQHGEEAIQEKGSIWPRDELQHGRKLPVQPLAERKYRDIGNWKRTWLLCYIGVLYIADNTHHEGENSWLDIKKQGQ